MNLFLVPPDCKTKTDQTSLNNPQMKNKELRGVIRKQSTDNEQAYILTIPSIRLFSY